MKAKRSLLAALAAVVAAGSAIGCYGYGSPNVYVGVAVPGPYVGYPYPYHGPYGGWVGRPYPSPYPRYEDPEAGVEQPLAGAVTPPGTLVAADTGRSEASRSDPAVHGTDNREN